MRTIFIATLFVWISACMALGQNHTPTQATKDLTAWNSEFERRVYKLTDRVYSAVGFGASNISVIVGDTGLIIIDTGRDRRAARQALAAFREISQLPVTTIIYTHSHRDHIMGTLEFIDPDVPIEIWAHKDFGLEARTLADAGLTYDRERALLQFGRSLPFARRINNGISPVYKAEIAPGDWNESTIPNRFLDVSEKEIVRAGVRIVLGENLGETYDQIYVWLPEEKVVFAGDNFYRTWPNLYPIRGTPFRDVRAWALSLDKLVKLNADHVVGGHTRPVSGAEQVREVLSNYRDAIAHVHDKTIEAMNQGLGPDELAEYVKLPDQWANLEYLRPFYGHPEWAARAIYSGYFGWFDGNPTQLFPVTPEERSNNIIELAGGREAIIVRAEASLRGDNPQWAAELCDYILAINTLDPDCLKIKITALETLANNTPNATARNFYFGVAQELQERLNAANLE